MKLRRVAGSAALTVIAVFGLTACQTKSGAAAIVDGTRITESQVSEYVLPAGLSPQAASQAASQGFPPARVEALSTLVQAKIYESYLAHSGGVPGEQQLAALHDQGAQRLLQATLGGRQLDKALRLRVTELGLKTSFADLLLRSLELGDAVINRTHAQSFGDLRQKLGKYASNVSVSPRYGRWDPNQLVVSTTHGAGSPPFVRFGSPTTG